MRFPFVAFRLGTARAPLHGRFGGVALLAGALVACVVPDGPARHDGLPGFPVAAPGEADGPVHDQRVLAFEDEVLVLLETLATDGRVKRRWRVRLDRHGTILARIPVTGADPDEGAPFPDAHPLPHALGALRVEVRPDAGRHAIFLVDTDEGIDARLALLPRAARTELAGLALPEGEAPPALGALSWRSMEGGARVEGVLVLDFVAGRARLHQRRGLAAHRAGRHAEAARHFETAWRTDPADPLGAYNLACALTALGQHERALSYLDRAVALDPLRIRVFAAQDPDLDPLRDHPEFARIAGPGAGHRQRHRPAP